MDSAGAAHQLASLATESRNERTTDLDRLPVGELVRVLHAENYEPARAVEKSLPQLAEAVEEISIRLRQGGKMYYFGAGTSGRIGILDASECPPTFGVDPYLIQGRIAGGDKALRSSIEGAEDEEEAGRQEAESLGIGATDVVVGIAASGRTPYVLGALRYAGGAGAYTIAVVNVHSSSMEAIAELTISAVTGPEPITGSTRLKAGTAQKMVLNLLSTATMVRLGKTYGNLMVDVRATNKKLRDRAIRIVSAASGSSSENAGAVLERCGWEAKVAILMLRSGLDVADANRRLNECCGDLRLALNEE